MNKSQVSYFAISAFIGLVFSASVALAAPKNSAKHCTYTLDQAGAEFGVAEIRINKKKLRVVIGGAQPDTLYTVWVDFRTTGGALPDDFPLGVRPVSPAMPTNKGVSNGIGLDRNGIMTDENGEANVKISLNYEILKKDRSPVVGGLAMQGLNVVGGFWMRKYPSDPAVQASSQITKNPFEPELVYSTAVGITIVRHPDTITHGLSPGVKYVDHFSAWKGDFPSHCLL